MTVSGDTLALSVDLAAGEYQYPLYVDPTMTVTDKELLFNPGSWAFFTDNNKVFEGFKVSKGLEDTDYEEKSDEKYYEGQYGFFSYTTQGASRIYAFVASAKEEAIEEEYAAMADEFELRTKGGEIESGNGESGKAEIKEAERGIYERSGLTVCAESACGPVSVSGSEQNAAYFEQKALTEEKGEFWFTLTSASVEIEQEKAPAASFNTSESTIEGLPNALYPGKWYKSTSNAMFGLDAADPGIGVYKQGLSSPSRSGWGYAVKNEARNECEGVQCNECYEPSCFGLKSGKGKPFTFSLASAGGGELPEGEDTIEGKVEDAAGLKATATAKIKVDNKPPSLASLEGFPSNHELVDGQHMTLETSAKSGPAGIASIVLDVDGQQVGNGQGSCSGSCTGDAVWTLSAANYAAGEHTLTVIAEDNAGNVETATYHAMIHHAEGMVVGPGSVNPVTGELSMAATDVSIGVPGGALTVSRSYRSRHLAEGKEGPLGPQWNLSLGAQQSLERVSGGMILTSGSGEQVVFESKGKGSVEFTSPAGDADLTLLEKPGEGKTVFTLSNNGSVTIFELPAGSSGSVWLPSSAEGPNGTSMTFYKFKLESGVIEPTEELAPIPANVSCGKAISELKEGCRALKFEYDEGATTAKGEKATEWGGFTKHLSKVRYIAWNSSKTKEEPVVAEYAYDVQGRLRAVWNPQIKPELKTTYGYDAEGHVTAVSTAGHEPELLEQGTIPGETNLGRLLAVAVPSAGTALGSGEAPGIKEVPTLSSTKPVVGTKINVNLVGEKEKTPGTWTANPLAFIYQWEDCNTKGEECSPIAGAVNQAYYPTASDEGHELVAQVRALNATGATTASTAATATVAKGTPNTPLPEPPSVGSDAVTTLEYQVPVSGSGAPYEMTSKELATWGQTDDPSEQAMGIFPPEKVMGWPAKEYKGETVYYLDGKDRAVNTALPTGGISATEYNLYNDVTRTLTPNDRLKAITEGCKAGEECKSATENVYEEKGSEPGTELLSTRGPQHTVELASGKEGKVNEEVLARERTSYYYNEGAPTKGGPYHLVTRTIDSAETASKEEYDKRTTETSYSGQSGLGWELRKPTSVRTDPSGLDLVHTTEYNSSTGDVIETKMPEGSPGSVVPPAFSSSFGAKGKENGQFEFPTLAALTSTGDIWVADSTENRVQEFNEKGEYQTQFGSAGTGDGQFKFPFGIAVEPSTGDIVVADREQARIQEFASTGTFIRAFGYGVGNGESKFEICTSECRAGVGGTSEGQLYRPDGITLDSSGNIWTVDEDDNRVEEYNEKGEYLKQFGVKGSEPGQIAQPVDIAYDNGNLYITEAKNQRVQEFSTSGSYITSFGSEGTGNGQFNIPYAITAGPKTGNLYVTDRENNRVEEFTSTGRFATTFGIKGKGNGQIEAPTGIAATENETVYVTDHYNERVQKWAPATQAAHDTKTIYYTAAANSEYETCGKQFAMANLPCETVPAAQPGTSELPELPTTKYTYNMWNGPETTVETVGSTTRTKTNTYDEAGRLKTAAISSTVGEPFPTVTNEYNKETGALEKQCTNSGKPCTEGKPKTIKSVYNKVGQLESYTDADENATTYELRKRKGRPPKDNQRPRGYRSL